MHRPRRPAGAVPGGRDAAAKISLEFLYFEVEVLNFSRLGYAYEYQYGGGIDACDAWPAHHRSTVRALRARCARIDASREYLQVLSIVVLQSITTAQYLKVPKRFLF